MDILEEKTRKIEETAKKQGVGLLSVPGSMKSNRSQIFANKSKKKITVLILNKDETKIQSYSVSLEKWLAAEDAGLATDDIMNNLVLVRALGIKAPQKATLQGNVFMEIENESVASYLGLE